MRSPVGRLALRGTALLASLTATSAVAGAQVSTLVPSSVVSYAFDQCFDDLVGRAPLFPAAGRFCLTGTVDVGRVASGTWAGDFAAYLRGGGALTAYSPDAATPGRFFTFDQSEQFLRFVAYPGATYTDAYIIVGPSIVFGSRGWTDAQARPNSIWAAVQWSPGVNVGTAPSSLIALAKVTEFTIVAPEPSTYVLLGTGIAAIGVGVRRRRSA
jgi:hypothetical protein